MLHVRKCACNGFAGPQRCDISDVSGSRCALVCSCTPRAKFQFSEKRSGFISHALVICQHTGVQKQMHGNETDNDDFCRAPSCVRLFHILCQNGQMQALRSEWHDGCTQFAINRTKDGSVMRASRELRAHISVFVMSIFCILRTACTCSAFLCGVREW